MISVKEAKQIINDSVKGLPPAFVCLEDAWDMVLAGDIFAPADVPAYRQSSMDGYAIAFDDLKGQNEFSIVGESAAGNRSPFSIPKRAAARIFTGAAVPEGADTVVMQERTKVHNGKLVIDDEALELGNNVRAKGAEIGKGELALPKDSYLSAAAIGFLANIGVTNATVYPKPSVGIILTGNELKSPGEPLAYGEVYESNSFALTAALRHFHIPTPGLALCKDDPAQLKAIMQKFIALYDLILLTGGVSVGDYDFVRSVAEDCGVKTLFHKIKQRPGKPLYFGMHGGKVIFGLPGNPSSVLTCFYEYVIPAIKNLSNGNQHVSVIRAPLAQAFAKKTPFTQFLKGYYNGREVVPLPGQESYKMNSFAKANCLIVLNEDDNECKAGDIKEIHLIL
ncbi:MAG: molybdopterin molybdotransferase MoeA [Chitinophagaceae bacterium]|nr:molybdopterin molybdotransferase MoeA [Chitinophagaceae bacterium]